MNREIKFRSWDGNVMTNYPELYDWNTEHSDLDRRYVTLMQFTGLKDKNGVDIYEGDIVKGKEGRYEGIRIKGWDSYQIGKVIMCVNTGSWQYTVNNQPHQLLCYLQEVEVIGNVFEHSELLNNQ